MDELLLLRGYDYKINNYISIHQPTLEEIFEYGEENYFRLVTTLCSIPSDIKASLFDIGYDYEILPDFNLFYMLTRSMTTKQTSILFGSDINFSEMQIFQDNCNDEFFMGYVSENAFQDGIRIDSYIYELITDYLRNMHGFTKNIEKAGNEFTKNLLIEESRSNMISNANTSFESTLKPLIVALVNCCEFKYNYETVWKLPFSIFMSSVKQIQKSKSVGYLMQGIYSGNVDTAKINKEDLNWM